MGEDSRAGALVPGRAPAPGLLENVQPWVALPQSCDRWPHIPASPPWDGLHLLHSHMYPQRRCRRGHGPRPAHSQQCLQNDSRQVHTHLAHTHTLYTHTLNTLTCAPALHSHTPAEAKPSRFGGVVRRLARPLCCPECTPFSSVHNGAEAGSASKGDSSQRASCARSSSPRLGRDGPLPHRLPEAASLGLQAEIIHDLVGIGASGQAGLNESLLRRHLEDAVHLQPGPGHLLLARAVGAL